MQYRNTVYGYPWYASVRKILQDPAYSDWWMKFKPKGPWYSPKCDDNYDPPRCSDYYHSQEQTPGYPTGDGNCAAPGCDCGVGVPCGFYVWNHSSTTVVNGQSFQDWFLDSYMFDALGASANVSGFFWDDVWNVECDIHDQVPQTCEDMGLTANGPGLQALTAAYDANMAALRAKTLAAGKFAWQMLWTGGAADSVGSTCAQPLVKQATCAADLRALCSADSPAQSRAMMYSFGPGGCRGDPKEIPELEQDLANFLLVRGPFAWLGHAWLGCSHVYQFPDALNVDYGEPVGGALCAETKPGSGVFTREWTKASVSMDCNKWAPSIVMKKA